MQSQLSYQDMQREEKNFMKNELLNANHAQEEVKLYLFFRSSHALTDN